MRNYAKTGGRPGLPGYRSASSFRAKVFRVVGKIPLGKTMTYGQVAKKIGHPKAYRAVGSVLKSNNDPKIPCHRVIRGDGTPGGYNKGTLRKRELLQGEGVFFSDNNQK